MHQCGDSLPTVTLTVNDSTGATNTTCTGTCTFAATATAGTHPLYDPQYASQGGGYINFVVSVNGGAPQVACKVPFTDTDTTTQYCPYSVPAAESFNIVAQVIDSVLYEGDSSSLPITATPTTAFNMKANTISNNISLASVNKKVTKANSHTTAGKH